MRVRVNLEKKVNDSYNILIENNLSKKLATKIVNDNFGKSYCIITDSKVKRLFGNNLLKQFKNKKVKVNLISFSAGEKYKTVKTVERISEEMLSKNFDRRTCVIALGGGVVGDLAGFVAATYLRGVNFVQVPTTLLAMVDSSVGGKTGVNLSKGKNSFGAFYQPKKVYIDPKFLKKLPKSEIRNGLSEVVKHAIIKDKKFFTYLEENYKKLLSLNPKIMSQVIKRNCEIKARVVEKDEKEINYRRIVNYGHTIGHALEVLGNYKKFKHGEAISIGMAVEAGVSQKMGYLSEQEAERIKKLLHNIGLPIKIPKDSKFSSKKIMQATQKDKKTINGTVYYALPKSIGKILSKNKKYAVKVADSVILRALEGSR